MERPQRPAEPDQLGSKSIYVVGNGPSLKSFDFSLLQGHDWIGMNAAYRHWQGLGFYPTHYACLDPVVARSHRTTIADMIKRADHLGIRQFLLADAIVSEGRSDDAWSSDRICWASSLFGDDTDLSYRVTTGSHAAYWATTLGYTDLTLLGIDLNYREVIPGLQEREGATLEVVQDTASPNYYFPEYQKVGDILNRPNPVPNVHKTAWQRILQRIAHDYPNVRVRNQSPISSLPGTIGLKGETVTSIQAEPDMRIELPETVTLQDALDRLLPSRFIELWDPKNLLGGDPSWRRVTQHTLTNEGRWTLYVEPEAPSDQIVPAPLASKLRFVRAEDNDPIKGLESYEYTITIHKNSKSPVTAVLALRLDRAEPARLSRSSIVQILSRLGARSRRLFWRAIRTLDSIRPSRG